MIRAYGDVFHLDTAHTSYLFRRLPTGQLEQLYYGRRVGDAGGDALWEKHPLGYGNTVAYSASDATLSLEQLCLEHSGVGKGDFRAPMVELSREDGCRVTDFRYAAHRIYEGSAPIPGLPSAYGANQTLEVDLLDGITGCAMTLFYHVFEDCDVIARHARLTAGTERVTVHRAMSLQVDLPWSGGTVTSFHGAWIREMVPERVPLRRGAYVGESRTGTSSSHCNPLLLLEREDCGQDWGDCYGFNLVYSGNHMELAEVSPQGRTRILCGLSPFCFSHRLAPGESFETPEAVMTYSHRGRGGVSAHFHDFVRAHIVRGHWKERPRPVLVNSWEANYFDFDEEKLVAQATRAAQLGCELYVVDDGWFAGRNGDATSLGDWTPDGAKLPHGLAGLAARFAQIPIALGLWIEPEMVSPQSALFRAHPDWALGVPGTEPSMGRNQLVLDLSREEVCDYLIDTFIALLSSADISYVKWDMNRNLSDLFSRETGHNPDLFHRYTLGYYRVMEAVTARFPQVLFEGCSAGGNRFDLGVLCYMPQLWTSDNTDALCRVDIQNGALYGYPPSVMGCHVSVCPNHYTARTVPLWSRFAVAAFGLLGYELDVTALSAEEAEVVRRQITFYKEHRTLFQFGRLCRLDLCNDNFSGWLVLSADRREGVAVLFQRLCQPGAAPPVLRFKELDAGTRYTVRALGPGGATYTAGGDLLCHAGLRLPQSVPTRPGPPGALSLPDFAAVIYTLEALPD